MPLSFHLQDTPTPRPCPPTAHLAELSSLAPTTSMRPCLLRRRHSSFKSRARYVLAGNTRPIQPTIQTNMRDVKPSSTNWNAMPKRRHVAPMLLQVALWSSPIYPRQHGSRIRNPSQHAISEFWFSPGQKPIRLQPAQHSVGRSRSLAHRLCCHDGGGRGGIGEFCPRTPPPPTFRPPPLKPAPPHTRTRKSKTWCAVGHARAFAAHNIPLTDCG